MVDNKLYSKILGRKTHTLPLTSWIIVILLGKLLGGCEVPTLFGEFSFLLSIGNSIIYYFLFLMLRLLFVIQVHWI